VRPLLIASVGTAFAGAAVWSAAGMVAMGSSFAPGSGSAKPELYFVKRTQAQPADQHSGKAPRLAAAAARPVIVASLAVDGKSDRLPDIGAASGSSGNEARFEAIVKQASLTSEKLAQLFNSAGAGAAKARQPAAKASAPAPERFASQAGNRPPMLLAYADPSPSGAGAALSALLTAPVEEDSDTPEETDEALALPLPDFESTPSDVPVPQLRPRSDQTRRPAAAETREPEAPRADRPAEKADGSRKAVEAEKPRQKLAYARPNDPSNSNGLGRTLRNLFGGGGARAGNGVAVYDISAARVYMPDGSVLEAHSGIGKMADDPRYVHVKMNGPTPPHTYNLRMREKRFHGVEAIRMLPVDGKNKHGRDGFLTHSYLLRGGRAESHGCVAFKNYDRFLNAFKQGKVKQLVVVPSGGRATMLASNGSST